MADSLYYSLRRPAQRLIDRTFYDLCSISGGGGFIPDPPSGGGGFIVDSPNEGAGELLALSKIPEALERLNLPPDDEEVLQVFKNAAQGWDEGVASSSKTVRAKGVTLDDFRSVCAVLLEPALPPADDPDMSEGGGEDDEDAVMEEEDADDSDEYAEDTSDSEYGSRSKGKPSTRRQRATKRSSVPSPGPSMDQLTEVQRQAALDTFELFLPPVPEGQRVEDQRLMISDIQRSAGLLKEQLKLEDITDMLQMFSTSPDKSMSFEDFTRMLVRTGLV